MPASSSATPETYEPAELARRVQRDLERSFLRFRNGIKYMAGIDRPGLGLTPKDTVWTRDKMQLWRYRSDQRRFATPVLMVMSLVSRSYIFDLRPGNSLVEYLLRRGFDVFVLDWGVPDHLDADNSLSTYTDDYLPQAVDVIVRITGADTITMNGYCFGGVLALLHAAAHPDPIRNLITMATPVDTTAMGPMNTMTAEGRIDPETLIGEDGNVPASVIENSFRMLKPTGEIADYVNLWDNLWNDEFMESYQAMTTWARDQIPFPGAAFLENVHLLGRQNLLKGGTVPIGGRDVHLADIRCPFLSIIGEKDHIVPLAGAQGLADLVGSEDKTELMVSSGHVGLFVGRSAQKKTLPPLCDWMEAHSERVP
jgi:polyhydroxyalkanoate synthase